jgi:methylated-DNA-[protein]-cysteine S-methyltransferase
LGGSNISQCARTFWIQIGKRSAIMERPMNYCYLDTPIGPLLIAGDAEAVRRIYFPKRGKAHRPERGWTESSTGPVHEAARQLREYFEGRRTGFDLPLDPEGTPFQRTVWRHLQGIPYGQTISYGELARRAGNPKASRAVGSANGANPLPIVIPCHRVIAANGTLGGFGGGLPLKEALLALETPAGKGRAGSVNPDK